MSSHESSIPVTFRETIVLRVVPPLVAIKIIVYALTGVFCGTKIVRVA